MKTLEEVIKIIQDLLICEDDIAYAYHVEDALHYLTEYRDMKKHLACLDDAEIRGDNTQVVNNPPLTWDELRTMEGKPVWIEGEHGCIWGQKAWSLIRLDPENDDLIICVSTDGGVHYEFAIGQEDYGTDWQAYRKER